MEQNFDSWVMNVVPVSGPNTLPVIYDRGLIGVMHDWYFQNCFLSYLLLIWAYMDTVVDQTMNI
jgi:hypothetical protein